MERDLSPVQLISPSRIRDIAGPPQNQLIAVSRLLASRNSVIPVIRRPDAAFGPAVPDLVCAAATAWVNAVHTPDESLFTHEMAALINAVGDPDVAAWLVVRGCLPEDDPFAHVVDGGGGGADG
jgi:hypothetical protein